MADVMKGDIREQHKVLIITYVFPPAAYVGTYRTLKYCKYLLDYGWTPVVLTIDPAGVVYQDEALSRQVPDHIRIYRTFDIDPAKWLNRLSRAAENSRGASTAAGPVRNRPPSGARRLWKRLGRRLSVLLTESPDSHVFWVPFAVLKGAQILLRENIDVIYCTSPPQSSHMAAFLLAKWFRKPYVLDFRDPWRPTATRRWLRKGETAAKKVIVRNAARVISVSRGERDEMRQEFPALDPAHFTFITNGYDPSDFRIGGTKEPSGKMTLTHAGTVYPGTGEEFFAALDQLVREHPGIETKIQVRLIGEIAAEYADAVRSLEATGMVRAYGPQAHATTLQMVLGSEVLVILQGGERFLSSHIPAKVFEYLCARKPIVAIAKAGDLTEIVTKSGLGIVISPHSVEELTRVLWDLYTDYADGRLARVPNDAYIRSFERAALTQQLAMILDEAGAGSHGGQSRHPSVASSGRN